MSFLSYTGDVEKINDDCYSFKMANNTKIIHDRYIEVISPVIDISFTKILGENKTISRCFLNSMIYPNNERIEDIEFLPTEVPGFNYFRYNLDYIRNDVLCKCYLKEDEEDDDFQLLIDIQMQIHPNKDESNKLLNYLQNIYKNEKIIGLVLIFNNVYNIYKNKGIKSSTEILKCKPNNKIIINKEFPIFRIDISKCYMSLFQRKENIWISNEKNILKNKGKEWIKFWSIPNWCGFFRKSYYLLPPLESKYFESDEIIAALRILKNYDRVSYEMYLYDQEVINQKVRYYEEKKKENQILEYKIGKLEKHLEYLNEKEE